MSDWRQLTPAEVLDQHVVLTAGQSAYVLGLVHTRGKDKGQPDRRAALELMRNGTLPLVDPRQPVTRWTVSSNAVRRYLNETAA